MSDTPITIPPDVIIAAERIIAAGKKVEIIPTGTGFIMKEVTQKTVYKAVDSGGTNGV